MTTSEGADQGIGTAFTREVGIEIPLICGAMYPCSNPELVAAVSDTGAIGIVQPLSMEFVFKRDLGEGLRYMRTLTGRPFGMNLIIEGSSKTYLRRVERWLDISLQEGIRFFITALGNPRWVVERARAFSDDVVVYHDVTERKFAEKALAGGVNGLICVNRRAGGHAGSRSPRELFEELEDLGVPLVCAGGVGNETQFVEALQMGYAGTQLGTRFLATEECQVHNDYKQAILDAKAEDIVLTDKISGVPVSVIKTPHVEQIGTRAGWLARKLLRGRKTKHWMRTFYSLKSVWQMGRAAQRGATYRDYLQAGRSVDGIDMIEPAAAVVERFSTAWKAAKNVPGEGE